MSLSLLLLQVLSTVSGCIVAWRAVMVINGMSHGARGEQPFWAWLGFGLGYVALAVAAAGSVLAIWHDQLHFGLAVWLNASAALIVCDRRRRRTEASA